MAPKKMPKGELSWEDWQKKANAEYVKGQRGAQEMIRDWGYPEGMSPDTYKIEFDKGKVKRKDRLVRKSNRAQATTQRVKALKTQTVGEDVYGKGVVAPKGSNLEEHHKRVVSVYQPFFEGLNDKETKELAQWFVDEGYGLGNIKENLSAANRVQHEAIHTWMRENMVEPTGKPLLNFKRYSLNERLPAAVLYLENVQAAVDEQLKKTLMPDRKALRAMAAAGIAAPSLLGTAASAAETTGRVQLARQTGNPVDWIQAGLAGASSAGDLAGYTGALAIPGEVVSTAADLANVAIDTARMPTPRPTAVPQAQSRPRTAVAARTQGQTMPKTKPLNLANEGQYFIVNPIRSAFSSIFGKREI